MDLRKFTNQLKNKLEILEGKEKGNKQDILDKVVTINDYGFINSKDGQYAVFVVKENNNFYNASSLLTDYLKAMEAEGAHEQIRTEGLPIRLVEKTSSNNRKYIDVEFYPNV